MSRMNVDRQSQYRTGTAQSGGGVRQSQQPMVNPAMYQSVSRPPLASAANGAPPSSQADVSYRPKTPSQLSQFIGGSPQRPSSSMNSLLNPYGNQQSYSPKAVNDLVYRNSGVRQDPKTATLEYNVFRDGNRDPTPQLLGRGVSGDGSGGQRPYNTMEINPFKDLTSGQQSNQPAFIKPLHNYQQGGASNAQAFMPVSAGGSSYMLANQQGLSQVPQQAFLPDEGAPPSPQSSAPITSYNTYSNKQYPGYARSDPSQNYSFWRDKVTQLGTAPPNVGELNEGYVSSVENMTGSDLGEHIQRNINKMLDGSGYNEFYPYYGLSKNIPPNYHGNLGGRYRRTRSGVKPVEENSSQISPNQASPLSNSPQRMQAPPPQAVSVPYERGFVGPYSAERALADFNAEAARLNAQPRESFSDFVNQAIEEGVAQGRQQGVTDANKIVDQNLAGSQGFYATPSQRRSGFFTQGMGALPSDAALMAAQNQPPRPSPAADAARADQERRRSKAEGAMQGVPSDGLTRYMPNADLMAFANAGRPDDNQLKAMTPAEIQFYRHKKNMAENPVYAERINAKREARSADLANQTKTRLEMAANRRQAAADAAGASQQLRNLMAGRGAIGGGQDGFNALMSLAAMQNPNQAFSDYGQAYQSLMAPEMQSERLGAQERMYGAGLKNELDLQAGQLGFNRDELKAREGMYGAGLKNELDLQAGQLGFNRDELKAREGMYDRGLQNALDMQGNQLQFGRDELSARQNMYSQGLQNAMDLQDGQLAFNREGLAANERMYGAGLQSQRDLQTQELGSREKIEQLRIGAQQSESAAQRAFEQAQQATNFQQRKELEELGQKYRMEAEDQRQKFEKESRDFQNRASIIAGADSSYDAREGLALYRDPDKYLDPQKNPGVDIPAFQPSQGAEGNRQQTYFEILDWAARNGLSEDNYRVQQELKKNQATPTPQEAEDWQSDIWWSQPMIGRYNYSPLAPSYQQQDLQRRYQDRLRKFMQPSP